MTMLDVETARALITTSLSDDDLEAVIEREESWLSRRIGPLDGERVEMVPTADGDEVLWLRRPALEASVEDGSGIITDFDIRGWSDLVRTSGSWSGEILATYTPTDEDEVRRSLVSLVRLTVNESAYAAESAGGYSAQTDIHAQRTIRYSAWRSLLRPRVPTTTRIRSGIPIGGRTTASVSATASGS
jgi:hypothetical protein